MNDLKIKLTREVCGLCKRALMRVHELTLAKRVEENPKANLISADSDFKAMHDRMCILTMELSWADTLILGTALRSYMGNVLREGSPDYKRGQDLMAALSDYSDTIMADSEAKEKMPASVLSDDQKRGLIRQFVEDMEWRHKRDAIFRSMVEPVNVWGDVVTETYLDPKVSPNPGAFPRGVYTMPLADAEVDQDLTNGEPIAFNERMKKEGTDFKPLRKEGQLQNLQEAYGGSTVKKEIPNTVAEARRLDFIA
jgi:hypothetical protein